MIAQKTLKTSLSPILVCQGAGDRLSGSACARAPEGAYGANSASSYINDPFGHLPQRRFYMRLALFTPIARLPSERVYREEELFFIYGFYRRLRIWLLL